jgi:aspartate aminotransferase
MSVKESAAIRLARRVSEVEPSATLAITAKAQEMRAAGRDVLGFGAGEPDFDTPDHIKEACQKALRDGDTKYTPAAGKLVLREAIAEKFRRDNGLSYNPKTEVIVTIGAKHALYELFQAVLDPGDEAIIPAPYWVSYAAMASLAGASPVIIPVGADQDFKVSPEQVREAITPRSKLLVINSPSNPTGMVYTPDELRALAEVALEAGLLIVSDEIYEKLLYDSAEQVAVASFSEEVKASTVTINGLSKTYSMTGWRLGYAAGPREIIDAMERIQSHATSNPTSFAQAGAVAALRGSCDFLAPKLAAFDERRRHLVDALGAMDGVRCVRPQGAFYVFPDFSGVLGRKTPKGETLRDAIHLAEYLLDEVGVALVPGEAFGAPGCARISYATSTATVQEGAKRIGEALARLR